MLNASAVIGRAAVTLAATLLLASCAEQTEQDTGSNPSAQSSDNALAVLVPGAGDYSRPISTTVPEAQTFFDQGLRLAWGFYFPEAIASHQEAARLDPTHPMPWWGMAQAMGPNPNSRYGRLPDDPHGEGKKAIRKAMELIDNADPMERRLIEAMHILYDDDSIADSAARDEAYLDAMRALNQEFPDDPDVAALYAASYMNIGRWDYWDAEGNPKRETIPVAEALEHVIEASATHPGVLHLHIHLIEASLQPERALVSADALEATMPVAGHVVHMPAHIYVRVGQYQNAIDQNVRSEQVDQDFAEIWGDTQLPDIGTYSLSHKRHAPHAIDFIRYAATVQGNYDIAIGAAERAKNMVICHGRPVNRAQKTLAAPWLVNKIFGQWDALVGQEPSHSGTPYMDGIWSYAKGSALAATGDLEGARAELAKLETLAESPVVDEHRVGATPASAVLKLSAFGLAGEIAEAEGRLDEAIEFYRQGVAVEDLNNYTEPPDWAQPMRHYLGAALLKANRPEEAEAVYRRDLRWNQNNGWSLFGLHQALAAQGKDESAATTLAQFEAAWTNPDLALERSRI